MKVLIVDDSAVMRKVIIRELLQLGFSEADLFQVEDGQEALDAVAKDTYDLILMDWNMPNMLGIDALKALRAAENMTPVIMVTTEAEKANIIMAIQAGANNYLAKPFNKIDFREKITQTIGELPTPAATPAAAPPPPAEPKQVIVDIDSFQIRSEH